jgi:hypothetical protein
MTRTPKQPPRPEGGTRFEALLIYPEGWTMLSPWIQTESGAWYRHHIASPRGSLGYGEPAQNAARHLANEINRAMGCLP